MCMEDIRIGRRKLSRMTIVDCGGNKPVQICGNAPNRTHLAIFYADEAQNPTYFGPFPDIAEHGGIASSRDSTGGTNVPLVFDIEQYGSLVTMAWYAFSDEGGEMNYAIVETMLEDQ